MLTRKLIERSAFSGSRLFNPKDSKGIPIYLGGSGGSPFALRHSERDLKVRRESTD